MPARLYHYAHALEVRLFQLSELRALRKKGVRFDKRFYRDLWRFPGKTEDWVNLARFLHPKEPVLLIDIGANIGDFTAKFLSIYRDSRSICFEPVKATFEQLAARFSANDRVVVHRCAISDAEGAGTIFLHPDDTLCTLAQYTEEANAFYKTVTRPSESVACHRLDDFNFDKGLARLLVKVDVQGLETEVIRGAIGTLRMADVVLLECSFANEYTGKEPSFAPSCAMLRDCGLYPVVFQDYGRSLSNYAFERDVLFVRRELLDRIWFGRSDA